MNKLSYLYMKRCLNIPVLKTISEIASSENIRVYVIGGLSGIVF